MRVRRNAKTAPKMRQLIVTRAQQDRTCARIAAALGISVRTVAKRRARSRPCAGCSYEGEVVTTIFPKVRFCSMSMCAWRICSKA
jgi:FixJ family two-component response regulator